MPPRKQPTTRTDDDDDEEDGETPEFCFLYSISSSLVLEFCNS
jgi:hypothetical protein